MLVDNPVLKGYDKDGLEAVVDAIKHALSDPATRALSNRAVQGKIWHQQTCVANMLTKLRGEEEQVRQRIMQVMSQLVYKFHDGAQLTTFARAGLVKDKRVHAGSSLEDNVKNDYDVFCLDSKERLYMTLKHFDWLKDFFRLYPMHFYENSFQFVDNIPTKKLPIKVKVIGLGIGGSVCVSGLAKQHIVATGYEKRAEKGPRSVTSRYQNASWRAYDIAAMLVDDNAYQLLIENRQRINVKHDDGSESVVSSDRVQIIIGSAIQAAIDSARRYGAELVFEADMSQYFIGGDGDGCGNNDVPSKCDVVALFCGAHTSQAFPGLAQAMEIMEWSDMNSVCKMWLRLATSDKREPYCQRGGEIGAVKWHYTIESARADVVDIDRIAHNLAAQHQNNMRKMENGIPVGGNGATQEELERKLEAQMAIVKKVKESIVASTTPGARFDYIFTNAPENDHNMAKRDHVNEHVCLDGGYEVEIKIARNSVFTPDSAPDICRGFNTDLVLLGGDASVPPNPLAAYGATLACEAAGNVVQLAVAVGHVRAIFRDIDAFASQLDASCRTELEQLLMLLPMYYEARSRSENYFQWVQTLICNLYSLPPFYPQ